MKVGDRMKLREYRDEDRDVLVRILKQNVPRYFAEGDVHDFEHYLDEKLWDRHYVYLDDRSDVVGCAGFYRKDEGVIGLAYMFFRPSSVGAEVIRPEFDRYLSRVKAELCPEGDVAFVLNTTPRVSAFLKRFGFVVTDVVEDGYAEGYDMVNMERTVREG